MLLRVPFYMQSSFHLVVYVICTIPTCESWRGGGRWVDSSGLCALKRARFHDIMLLQVQMELKQLLGRDHQLLHLYINIQNDSNLDQNLNEILAQDEELKEEGGGEKSTKLRSCLRWFCCCCCCRWKRGDRRNTGMILSCLAKLSYITGNN